MKKTSKKPPKSEAPSDRASETQQQPAELKLKIEPRGPDKNRLDALARKLVNLPAIRKSLKKNRTRLLSFDLVEPDEAKKDRIPSAPKRFRATIYDYTANRAIIAEGRLDDLDDAEITESGVQPPLASAEFEEAVNLLSRDPHFGPAIAAGQLQLYPPMQPLRIRLAIREARLIFRAPSLTRMQIEIRSSRVKEHQSGLPQIRQGLRRLTRPKMVEVDVGMTSLPAALSSNRGSTPISEVPQFPWVKQILPISAGY